jgi:uncharacterized protein YndB with AHSA1/START domain
MITVKAIVNAPIEKTWEMWTSPAHIMKWNTPSEDWHTTKSENDLRKGGSFSSRMEAKDGSYGFDFGGIYDEVKPNEHIAYTLGDGRKVKVDFKSTGGGTEIIESFDPESQNSEEMQRGGWQAIMDNFKKYVEAQ